MSAFDLAVLVAILITSVVVARIRKSRSQPLPPGPKGIPLVGNAFDVPPTEQWVAYKEMSKKYGSDLIHLNMFGSTTIVVNSQKAAQELFDKRSSIYADRPRLTMLNELLGFRWDMAFMRYGDHWKACRTLFRKELGTQPALAVYNSNMTESTRAYLQKWLTKPGAFDGNLRYFSGSIILSIAYGIQVQPENDPYVEIAERAMNTIAITGFSLPAYLMDAYPWIRHAPSWLAGFKRQATELQKPVRALPKVTFDFVKKSMADGTASSSVASRNLQKMEDEGSWSEKKELELEDVCASMYAAGADTIFAALSVFMLAMTMYPDVLKRGQAAVDAVVGTDRLPTFDDQATGIPYVDALVKEVLRWKPMAPLAVSRSNTQDDVYDGYFIPKGSIVVGNAWAVLMDPAVYGKDVDEFRPERFLTADGKIDPKVRHPDAAFGFGRRLCAGQQMAEKAVWIAIASMLTVFDVKQPLDEKGQAIRPTGECSSGLLCHPLPFEYEIKPRNAQVEAILRGHA